MTKRPEAFLETERELYEQRQLTVAEIAKTLGVSRASIYRNLSSATSEPS